MQVFTQYLVSLEVENPEGSGPATTVVVMTDEGGERERWQEYKYDQKHKYIHNVWKIDYKYNINTNIVTVAFMADANENTKRQILEERR